MSKIIEEVCKIGHGNECCRYLVIGSKGFECMKNTEMKHLLDSRVQNKMMTARGDNCEGKTVEELN